MYEKAEHDFTWICTNCLYEVSDYTDIEEFREHIGIDFTKQRQKRTKNDPKRKSKSHGGASR